MLLPWSIHAVTRMQTIKGWLSYRQSTPLLTVVYVQKIYQFVRWLYQLNFFLEDEMMVRGNDAVESVCSFRFDVKIFISAVCWVHLIIPSAFLLLYGFSLSSLNRIIIFNGSSVSADIYGLWVILQRNIQNPPKCLFSDQWPPLQFSCGYKWVNITNRLQDQQLPLLFLVVPEHFPENWHNSKSMQD